MLSPSTATWQSERVSNSRFGTKPLNFIWNLASHEKHKTSKTFNQWQWTKDWLVDSQNSDRSFKQEKKMTLLSSPLKRRHIRYKLTGLKAGCVGPCHCWERVLAFSEPSLDKQWFNTRLNVTTHTHTHTYPIRNGIWPGLLVYLRLYCIL